MSKYMIRCDMEGISGIVSYDQAEPTGSEYDFGQRMFMSDLLACINGLQDGGADEVVIYDEHYYGRNIDMKELPVIATAICGKPPYRDDWAGGLDDSFDGMVLLGFHAKAGTTEGLLDHSYELDIADLRLNGTSVGEIGMEAAIAGDCDVPTLLVVGDQAGVREATRLMQGIQGVVVKEGMAESGAVCYPLLVTGRQIQSASARIVKDPPPVKPFKIDPPVTLEVKLREGDYLEAVRARFGEDLRDNHILVIEAPSTTAAWATYWQRKLTCQTDMKDNT